MLLKWPNNNLMRDLPLLSDLFSDFNSPSTHEVTETDDDYRIQIDLPGTLKKEIKLRFVSEDTLLLQWTRNDTSYKKHIRLYGVNKAADTNNVKAKYQNGVLEVILPKLEEAKPRDIPVS